MGKRAGLAVVAMLLIGVGFGAGWLAHASPARAVATGNNPQPGTHPGPEDEFAYWLYSPITQTNLSQGGPLHIGVFSTVDDLATVAAWYEKRLGDRIPLGEPGAIGVGGGPDIFQSAADDSFQPVIGKQTRPVQLAVGARTSPFSSLTVTLSRAEGENHTHIVVSFSRR